MIPNSSSSTIGPWWKAFPNLLNPHSLAIPQTFFVFHRPTCKFGSHPLIWNESSSIIREIKRMREREPTCEILHIWLDPHMVDCSKIVLFKSWWYILLLVFKKARDLEYKHINHMFCEFSYKVVKVQSVIEYMIQN